MGPQMRHWVVSLSVCVWVCLGVSFLLYLGILPDLQPTGISLDRSGRSPVDFKLQKAHSTSRFVPECRHPAPKINSSSLKYMRRFTGRKMVTYTSVFPRDRTTLRGRRRDTEGNEVISTKVISRLKLMYQSTLNIRDIHIEFARVEQTCLLSGLVIYFIETNTTNLDSDIQHFITVQNGALCSLSDFSVDLSRRVVVVATSMNLGDVWMQHFIKEFEEIIEKTNEDNFQIILMDFMSENVDVRQLFEKSILRDRSMIIAMDMTYNKPIGVEKAVALIQNPEDIVFLCDFHLEIPLDIFTLIRKHVIPGHMVFSPVVAKLNEGSSPLDREGVWDYNGFGMLGISRADWDVIGGINTRDFSDQWGGEDWDMIDRIIQHRLHVSRQRVPGFFHHHHGKTGMWPGGRLNLADI